MLAMLTIVVNLTTLLACKHVNQSSLTYMKCYILYNNQVYAPVVLTIASIA